MKTDPFCPGIVPRADGAGRGHDGHARRTAPTVPRSHHAGTRGRGPGSTRARRQGRAGSRAGWYQPGRYPAGPTEDVGALAGAHHYAGGLDGQPRVLTRGSARLVGHPPSRQRRADQEARQATR